MSQESKNRPQDEANPIDPRDIVADEVLGGRQWKRSKLGYITGLGTFRDAAQSVFQSGADSAGRLKGLGNLAFGRDKSGRTVDQSISGAKERFSAAAFINGRSDQQIRKSVDVTYRQAMMYAFLIAIVVALGIGSLAVFGPTFPEFILLDIVMRIFPLPLMGALLLRSAYTNWMFRRRELHPLRTFLSAKDRMPRKSGPSKGAGGGRGAVRGLAMVLGVLVASSIVLDAAPALAQDYKGTAEQVVAAPKEGSQDLFVNLLSFMVPGVGPIPKTTEAGTGEHVQFQGMKAAFMVFSGTLLFIGSMIAGWQVISGIVASAKEGKVLGQSYHEVWAPARMVIGFGMLAPIAGGLCAAQIVVLYLIVWGGNLANVVWVPYITSISASYAVEGAGADATDTVRHNNDNIANTTVRNILSLELCHAAITTYADRIGAQDGMFSRGRSSLIIENPTWKRVEGWDTPVNRLFASDEMHVYDYGPICGKIETYVVPFSGTPDADEASAEEYAKHLFSTEQKAQIEHAQSEIREVVGPIAESYQSREIDGNMAEYFRPGVDQSELIEVINGLRTDYASKMAGHVPTVISAQNTTGDNPTVQDVVNSASSRGWASSGVFYMTLSRLQNAVYSASSRGAGFTHNKAGSTSWSDEIKQVLEGGNGKLGVLTSFNSWWAGTIAKDGSDMAAAAADPAGSTNGWEMMDTFFSWMTGLFQWSEGVDPLNPMKHMTDFGNRLMTWGMGTYVAAGLAEATSNGVSNAAAAVPGFGGFIGGFLASGVGMIIGLVKMLALVLIAAGAIHAYILPMVPYVMTTFFVGGMIILTVEALVAAPIWAFFHIRMDGQDFISDVQKPGYMIAFNLILRPALMVFGLILSYIVFGGMAWFVEMTFYPTARSMTQSSGAGPLSGILMVVMVTYIHYQLAIRSFSLITQVPDRVTRWFGQGGEHLGEDKDSEQTSAILVGQTNSRVESMARGAGLAGRGGGRDPVKPKPTKDPTPPAENNTTGGGGPPPAPGKLPN